MEKLVFLADDHDDAVKVIDILHSMDVTDDQISVIAKEGSSMKDLPEPEASDGSDVVPAFVRGATAGGVTGLIAGLVAVAFPPAGLVLGGAAVFAGAVGGASFGAFAAALIGVSVPDSALRDYEDEVDAGRFLMITEVEDDQVDPIIGALRENHPDLQIKGTKDFAPAL